MPISGMAGRLAAPKMHALPAPAEHPPSVTSADLAREEWTMRRASPVVSLTQLVTLTWVTSGCSLIFVKGPQPEVQPPPPCTASNSLPTADAVLAGLSVAALVAGAVVYANGKSQEASGCNGGWF